MIRTGNGIAVLGKLQLQNDPNAEADQFKAFRKLLRKRKLKSIPIDIDISVVNVEGHQDGAVKGYNPKKPGNRCYKLQLAFCDELKAYRTSHVKSGETYTANGAIEMIKKIEPNSKMRSWNFHFAWTVVILTKLSWKRSNRWVAVCHQGKKAEDLTSPEF